MENSLKEINNIQAMKQDCFIYQGLNTNSCPGHMGAHNLCLEARPHNF